MPSDSPPLRVQWTTHFYIVQLSITQLPWNGVTVRRIAELWGNLESMGENINRVLDCEKVTMLLTTEQHSRIEESIEVESGNIIHEVHVREWGFIDTSVDPLIKIVDPNDKDKTPVTEEQWESLPEKDQESQEVDVDVDARGSFGLEEDAFNAKSLERDIGS
ncbi:hypothetical protein GQ457_14G021180 [Hibiscus cannabinus]